jgi:hypothetical protein
MADRRREDAPKVPDKDDQMDDVHAPYKEEEVEVPAAPGTPDNR